MKNLKKGKDFNKNVKDTLDKSINDARKSVDDMQSPSKQEKQKAEQVKDDKDGEKE